MRFPRKVWFPWLQITRWNANKALTLAAQIPLIAQFFVWWGDKSKIIGMRFLTPRSCFKWNRGIEWSSTKGWCWWSDAAWICGDKRCGYCKGVIPE